MLQNVDVIANFTGSGVGMLAFGSPILAHAIAPPFITISGFAPKKDGFHITRSANFPTCRNKKYNEREKYLFDYLNISYNVKLLIDLREPDGSHLQAIYNVKILQNNMTKSTILDASIKV
jgi:hypothetical protein